MKHTMVAMAIWLTWCGLPGSARAQDLFGTGANQVVIPFVIIRDAGNSSHGAAAPSPAGSVTYNYRISRDAVTNNMVRNAVLSGLNIGIPAAGIPADNLPITLLTWNQAARFVNWLNLNATTAPGIAACL